MVTKPADRIIQKLLRSGRIEAIGDLSRSMPEEEPNHAMKLLALTQP